MDYKREKWIWNPFSVFLMVTGMAAFAFGIYHYKTTPDFGSPYNMRGADFINGLIVAVTGLISFSLGLITCYNRKKN